jgi:hypothetical protein
LLLTGRGFAAAAGTSWRIIVDSAATPTERFAARELQRYLYVCTGELAMIAQTPEALAAGPAFVIGTTARVPIAAAGQALPALAPSAYRVRMLTTPRAPRLIIAGGDPIGVLYGVYAVAEKLGVRFYLSGDVVPDERVALEPAALATEGRPLFSVRGLQPFHDFAEGPDWWNTDDYLAHIGQLAKLRMNFLGLHTYPDSDVGPEPTVWIGPREEFDAAGRVASAYPASYHTTGRSGRGWWAYAPTPTSAFAGGAAALFDRDEFGPDVMRDHSFEGQTAASAAEVFNRTAAMLGTAFAEARRLGVLTCIGTETPLTIPPALQQRVAAQGARVDDPATTRALYRGMFERISRAMPADYFWLWTPENWTWGGNRPDEYARTAADIQAALDALHDLKSPMRLATCGWVLGPQHDRAALDHLLPPDSPMSAINSSVGHVAIDRQFSRLSARPRWAIPWLENDGNLTTPQLWAGRMRFDAADARRLGCTGLIGIHWRTRVLSPAIAALAGAAWDQSWAAADFDSTPIPPLTASGATGGHPLVATAPVSGVAEAAALGATNRVGMTGYDLLVPSGKYSLRLSFSEIGGAQPGERVFDVRVNGTTLLERFDIAARHGANHAVAIEFQDIAVSEGRLLIELVAVRGEPALAGLQLRGVTEYNHLSYHRAINCGGPELPGFEADELPGQPRPPTDRAMPVAEFYRDFAAAQFGAEPAAAAARLLAEIDGVALPMPTLWIDGPGDIRHNRQPWSEVAPKYGFVDRWQELRAQVRGAANLDRFDYWAAQFRAMRLLAEIGCTAGALDRVMSELAGTTDPAAARGRAQTEALPMRLHLASLWTELLRTEMSAVSNSGELGTLANLEQRSRVHQRLLDRHDDALRKLLGCDLPLAAWPTTTYSGPARIVVPTVRTAASAGERVMVRTLLVGAGATGSPTLCWRWLGETEYRREPAVHVARQVWQAALPALNADQPALEYHLEASIDGTVCRWPVSDRGLDQTVILAE